MSGDARSGPPPGDGGGALPAGPVVTLYGRPGCHLCAEALEVVRRARARVPFELVEVDIEADDELFKRLLERIPVVAINGDDHAELFIDEEDLVSALSSAPT